MSFKMKLTFIILILLLILFGIYYFFFKKETNKILSTGNDITPVQDGNQSIVDTTLNDIGIEKEIDMSNIHLPDNVSKIIEFYSNQYNVDSNLIKAQAYQESRGNQNALSRVGAIGVMQLMPATATWLNVNPYDLTQNIEGGIKYMSNLLKKYSNNFAYALMAYNWGASRVDRDISIGDFSNAPQETIDYARIILNNIGQSPLDYGVCDT